MFLLGLHGCSNNRYYAGPVTDHFDGKKFYDPQTEGKSKSFVEFLKWRISSTKGLWPKEKVEIEHYSIPPQQVIGSAIRVHNVGHVTFLIQTGGINILTDPVWSKRASPVSFLGPERIIAPGINFEDLPKIDVVLISHNHYDHLDLNTINKLWKKFKPLIIAPLGNDSIIKKHNKDIQVKTLDWAECANVNDEIIVHAEPMQHWSARGLFDENNALWAAFVIDSPAGKIYFVGDSGYGEGVHFKNAKAKYKDFRLALLPMGAYNPRWFMKNAHMGPDEMLKAHQDLGFPYVIPSHYDVFPLADDAYGEALAALNLEMEQYIAKDKVKTLKVGEYFLLP